MFIFFSSSFFSSSLIRMHFFTDFQQFFYLFIYLTVFFLSALRSFRKTILFPTLAPTLSEYTYTHLFFIFLFHLFIQLFASFTILSMWALLCGTLFSSLEMYLTGYLCMCVRACVCFWRYHTHSAIHI